MVEFNCQPHAKALSSETVRSLAPCELQACRIGGERCLMTVVDSQHLHHEPKDPSTWREPTTLVGAGAFENIPLTACCENTVQLHAKHNEMMVCNECKQIIKCFKEEKPLRAYLKFCESRHRKISTSIVGVWKVVTFASYEKFVR